MTSEMFQTGFSEEQISSLLAALDKLDAAKSGGADEQTELVHGTPLDDLCKEELAKYQCHPTDLWVRLERWTQRNEMAEGLDQFLLRHLGFFNVEPASPGYMVRLRLPACRIDGDQLSALADIAQRYAAPYCHVTTRGNLQLREIAPKNVLNVLGALSRAGLSCQGSGADSARNLTTSPTAGFDGSELLDLSPFAQRLSNIILNTRELRALPRKFNISFDCAGSISAVSDSNDVCFQAVQIKDHPELEAGVYCRLSLGGISGHQDLARDTGTLCTPEQSVMVGVAILNVFVRHGDRTNRKRARLKYVLDEYGLDWFVEQIHKELQTLDAGFELAKCPSTYDLPRPPVNRSAHIGVHAQKAEGHSYVGLALKMGRLSVEQMRTVGDLAARYGANEVRLTVWQNLLIPHVPNADCANVVTRVQNVGLGVSATSFAAGAVGCTGKTGCKLGLAHTKEDGLALVKHLEQRFTMPEPINIHLTGCPNSCAQHYIGDIGLMGTTLADGGEGYYLVLGGGSDEDRGIGRATAGPIPASLINQAVEDLVRGYFEHRQTGENFLSYVRKLPDDKLPTLISVKTLTA